MDISHNFPTMELISVGEFRRTSFQLGVENWIELLMAMAIDVREDEEWKMERGKLGGGGGRVWQLVKKALKVNSTGGVFF